MAKVGERKPAGTRGTGKSRPKVRIAALHGTLIRYLGLRIVDGTYPAGDILPTERDLSEQLKVSRGAFREAIRYLAAKGLVESRRKRGTRVLDRTHWNFIDPDVLEWMSQGQPDAQFMRSLQQLRLIFEPPIAELAARFRTDADLKEMRDSLAAMAATPHQSAERINVGVAVHRSILVATHNELLISLGSSIDAAMHSAVALVSSAGNALPDSLAVHKRLYEAIERQDTAEARALMRTIVEMGFVADTSVAVTDARPADAGSGALEGSRKVRQQR